MSKKRETDFDTKRTEKKVKKTFLRTTESFFKKEYTFAYVLVLPAVAIVIGLVFYPIFLNIFSSFTKKLVGQPTQFVGLKNYYDHLTNFLFRTAARNTSTYTFCAVGIKFLVGLIMALLVNKQFPGRNIIRICFILPWFIPTIVACATWRWMFNDLGGVINSMLMMSGIIRSGLPWLGNPRLAMISVIMVNVWKGFGFFFIILLAGLQDIDIRLYEAAEIDGASSLQGFFHITLPSIKNVATIVIGFSLIWTFNDFQIVHLLTRGGPFYATELFSTLMYRTAFISPLDLGKAATIPMLIFPVFAVCMLILLKVIFGGEQRQ